MKNKKIEKLVNIFPYASRADVLKIMNSLFNIPRTGWVDRGVKNPETVGDRNNEMLEIAEALFGHIPGILKMVAIYDWPKSDPEVGDKRSDSLCPPQKRASKEDLAIAKSFAMEKICATLKDEEEAEEIMKLWQELQEEKTHRAQLVKQMARLQTILKAIEYQMKGEPVKADEFIADYSKDIKHHILKEMLNSSTI